MIVRFNISPSVQWAGVRRGASLFNARRRRNIIHELNQIRSITSSGEQASELCASCIIFPLRLLLSYCYENVH